MTMKMNPREVPMSALFDLSAGLTLLDDDGAVLGVARPDDADASADFPITRAGVVMWVGYGDGRRLMETTAIAVSIGDTYTLPLGVRLSAY